MHMLGYMGSIWRGGFGRALCITGLGAMPVVPA
jgi:hypothetical protein